MGLADLNQIKTSKAKRADPEHPNRGGLSPARQWLRYLCAVLSLMALGRWWLLAQSEAALSIQLPWWCASILTAAAALFRPFSLRIGGRTAALAGVMMIATAWPRIMWLEQQPKHVSMDEALFPRLGIEALRNDPWSIWHQLETRAIPRLGEAVQALPSLFTSPLFGIRLSSVVQGLIAGWMTYCLAARLFGNLTALISASFLCCSFWHLVYSRFGLPVLQPVMALPAVFYFAARGEAERNLLLSLIAGLLLGASLLLYTPTRIVVPIFLAWWAHRVVTEKAHRRELLLSFVVIAAGASLYLAPFLHAFGIQPLVERYGEVFAARAGSPDWVKGFGATALAARLRSALSIYYPGGSIVMADGYMSPPLLDPLSAALVIVGLVMAARRSRESSYFLLFFWVVSVFVVGQLLTDVPTAAYRAAPMMPAIAICAALATRGVLLHLRGAHRPVVAVMLFSLLVLPWNLMSLKKVFDQYRVGPALAQTIASGPRELTYLVVSARDPHRDEVVRLLAAGRQVRFVPSVAEMLGQSWSGDVIVVLDIGFQGAELALRRCYPGARPFGIGGGDDVALALLLPEPAIAAGVGCKPRGDRGLLARYFAGASWDGTVVRERVEEWPVRTGHDLTRYHSVEWSGRLRVPIDGEYGFRLNDELAEGWFSIAGEEDLPGDENKVLTLRAGVYPLRVRCRPSESGSSCLLYWIPPGGIPALVDPEWLVPPANDDDRVAY